MDKNLVVAQAMKYAEEFRALLEAERDQRRAAEEALARLEDSYGTTVRALAAVLELRDYRTGGHSERVTRLGLELARRIAPELLDDPQLEYGFLLHDLGKIGIPDAVLLKPGPLSADERRVMREHAALGERIVSGIPHLGGLALEIVAAHHERWDGRGYPHGLKETAIPLAARVFAVVDAFDALTNDRPYRPAQPVERALAEIESSAGTQFDPAVVAEFVSLIGEMEAAA